MGLNIVDFDKYVYSLSSMDVTLFLALSFSKELKLLNRKSKTDNFKADCSLLV